MTRTAKRRWTRELSNEVDGIALGDSGPLLLHVYDPPAGGRWVESSIPGKLASIDRSSGDVLWLSPCEVGYGRGFGAGFGPDGDAIVMGPSAGGHRIVRMSVENGEFVAMNDVRTFDEALVFPDLCLTASATHVSGVDPSTLSEQWIHAKKGERYHHIGRTGNRVFVVGSDGKTKKQGVLCLDAKTGKRSGSLLANNQKMIHDMAVDERAVVVLCSNLAEALPPELLIEYLTQMPDDAPAESSLALLALDPAGGQGDAPLWFENLDGQDDEFLEASISADSGKLYLVRGALLEVRDVLTGRHLGEWAIPGLDERVAWQVSQGAGLLAEETRVSVFELPA